MHRMVVQQIHSAFMVDRVDICISSSLKAVQNLVVVFHTPCTHVGGPKQFGGPRPLHCSHVCHLTKFRPLGQTVGRRYGSQFFGTR